MTEQEEELIKLENERERREHLEHQDVLLAINSMIQTDNGKKLFSYLFKSLDVGEVPERGMVQEDLQDYLGFLRAGNSIYKLVCEADPNQAALIVAENERKKYEDRIEEYRIQNAFTTEY